LRQETSSRCLSNIGSATPVTAQLDAKDNLATVLGGVQVLVSGVPAPMIYASATQVSAVVPYEGASLSGILPTMAGVEVKYLSQTSNIVSLSVEGTLPGIFDAESIRDRGGRIQRRFQRERAEQPGVKGAARWSSS
jgi:uncharacterized protein (TIGR03437 family)